MGYASCTKKNPSYHDPGDYSEAVQVDFDPSRISYREVLDIFWKGHDPTRNSWFRQYRAAIVYHNEEQGNLATGTRDRVASETKGRIATAIEPYSGFYIAEDYHQKDSLRLYHEIMKGFRAIYSDMKSLANSKAVARINGYLGGYGSCDSLKEEIEGFGLSHRAREILTSGVCARNASIVCPVH
ncbi:MAG TPA: methionine sulfoxide reductase [Nitrospiraceae bacterium]|nr:methionine sulfoxide reductase [Nitrospiraceae bacterium]